jgi:hypothetical protein
MGLISETTFVSCMRTRTLYRVIQKKTGDFLRQPQIASGQVIYQNDGNFLEIMCVKFGSI